MTIQNQSSPNYFCLTLSNSAEEETQIEEAERETVTSVSPTPTGKYNAHKHTHTHTQFKRSSTARENTALTLSKEKARQTNVHLKNLYFQHPLIFDVIATDPLPSQTPPASRERGARGRRPSAPPGTSSAGSPATPTASAAPPAGKYNVRAHARTHAHHTYLKFELAYTDRTTRLPGTHTNTHPSRAAS